MATKKNSVLVEEGDTWQTWHPSLDVAIPEAEKQIAAWKDPEGWCEQVEEVCVLQVTHQATGDYGKGFTLQETEAGKLLRLAPAVIEAAKHLDDYVQMVGVLNMESPRDLLPFLGRLGRAISAFEAKTSEGTDA